MALLARSTVRLPAALGPAVLPVRPLRLVIARVDPPAGGARVTREFREGDSEVTIPGAPSNVSNQSDGLYVNTDMPPRVSNGCGVRFESRLSRKQVVWLARAECVLWNK